MGPWDCWIQAGYFVFGTTIRKRSVARLDISSDFDDEVPEPATGGRVSQKLKSILSYTDEWAKNPDYQRVRSDMDMESKGQKCDIRRGLPGVVGVF